MRFNLMMGGARVCYGTGDGGGGGTQDSGGTGDNGGGNSGTGDKPAGTQDNPGTGFDPAAFWNEPKPPASGSPSGGSADSGAGGGGGDQQTEGQKAGKEFAERLSGLAFGDVFTPEIATQVAEGDLKGANAAFATQLRQATQHSVVMAAQLMQKHGETLLQRVQTMIDAKLNGRDNDSTLTEHFPSAKDPALRPMIQGVFDQALKLAGGDRTKAVASTREMLKYMGTNASSDLGLNNPPNNPEDTSSAGSKSLVDELLGR